MLVPGSGHVDCKSYMRDSHKLKLQTIVVICGRHAEDTWLIMSFVENWRFPHGNQIMERCLQAESHEARWFFKNIDEIAKFDLDA